MGEHKLKKEYILWFRIVALVVIVWAAIIWMLFEGFQRSQAIYFMAEQNALQSKVSATLKTYEVFSNYIFEEVIANESVLSLMYRANYATEDEKDAIRNELYNLLEIEYDSISRYDFRQLHFHLPSSESFLRMHKPSKYGDLLMDIRETVRLANEGQEYIFGFEEGRLYNSYRFVYPLTYRDEPVGTVEISLPVSALMSVLHEQYPYMDTYFLMNEEGVKDNVFENQSSNYLEAEYFEGYVYDRSVYDVSLQNNKLIDGDGSFALLNKVHKEFLHNEASKESFSLVKTLNHKDYLLQFLTIENVSGDKVGYFLAVQENNAIVIEEKDFYIECALVSLLMLLFLSSSFLYVRYQIRINEATMKDNLTGLYNRHKFNEVAERELQRCKRYGGGFSLLMIDIDFFKRVNDTYGHLKGDVVLKELADLLLHTLRVTDLVSRWGGEEFICCLPNTNEEQMKHVAEKLRKSVETYEFTDVGHITVSIGGTLVNADDVNLNAPIGRADNALYMSKNNGRNRSTVL